MLVRYCARRVPVLAARAYASRANTLSGKPMHEVLENKRVADMLKDYHCVNSQVVHWGDQDAFGHLNNVEYLRYFESGRLAYFERLAAYLDQPFFDGFFYGKAIGPIAKSQSCKYKQVVTYPDTLAIGTTVRKLDADRFTMEHLAISLKTEAIVASGDCVVVTYDYRKATKVPMPLELIKAWHQLERERMTPTSQSVISRPTRKASYRKADSAPYIQVDNGYFFNGPGEESGYEKPTGLNGVFHDRHFTYPRKKRLHSRQLYLRLGVVLFIFLTLLGAIRLWRRPSLSTHKHITSTSPLPPTKPQQDHYLLYRILGNDLPPRHKPGQTLSNLRFILEHEPAFPNTLKYWVLNRIVDPTNEAVIISLLKQHDQKYIRIPFDEEEYSKVDFRLEDFPEPDFMHSDEYMRFSKVAKLRTIDYTYHDKNLYAMNNNGGRNTVLRHAKSIDWRNARWILPLDGNCYLTAEAMEEIQTQLRTYGDQYKYFVVPMARLLNNSMVFDHPDQRPKTPEEPQIIFRNDAQEVYNLNMRYGRRSKLELLWRLGALETRRALNKPVVPWETQERPYSEDKGNFKNVGWVFRLFSGQAQQEENKKEATSIRAFNRLLAIQDFLDGLDEKIARRTFRQEHLLVYDEERLKESRFLYWGGDQAVNHIVGEIVQAANRIVFDLHAMFHVEENATKPSEGNVTTIQANRHGHFLKADFMADPEAIASRDITNLNLPTLFENITTLALAHYYMSDEAYGRWSANLVRFHFLNAYPIDNQDDYHGSRSIPEEGSYLEFLSDQGYSFPSLSRVPRLIPKYRNSTVPIPSQLTTTDIAHFLDSLRLLRRAHALTHKEYLDLQSYLADWLEYLVNSPTGIHLAQMPDHRGTLYDFQAASLAAFTDDLRLFLRIVNRSRMRIGKMFTATGDQPFQRRFVENKLSKAQVQRMTLVDGNTSPDIAGSDNPLLFHFTMLNLQYWTQFARAIQNSKVDRDIWGYEAKNGASIRKSVVAFLRQHQQLDTSPDVGMRKRLAPLYHLARHTEVHSQETIASEAWDQLGQSWGERLDAWSGIDPSITNPVPGDASSIVAVRKARGVEQLEKYGWSKGQGLGKNRDGIKKAISIAKKDDTKGVGAKDQWDFAWWDHLYNKSAVNVDIVKEGNEVKISTKDTNDHQRSSTGIISTHRPAKGIKVKEPEPVQKVEEAVKSAKNDMAKRIASSMLYGAFVKSASTSLQASEASSAVSTPGATEPEILDYSQKVTDEELFAACEGRTARKGAVYDQTGKLTRVVDKKRKRNGQEDAVFEVDSSSEPLQSAKKAKKEKRDKDVKKSEKKEKKKVKEKASVADRADSQTKRETKAKKEKKEKKDKKATRKETKESIRKTSQDADSSTSTIPTPSIDTHSSSDDAADKDRKTLKRTDKKGKKKHSRHDGSPRNP
ncbi:hypothetical protein BZG36_03464 [Bifiguratus adelaidae]|uniref:G-patch domain-containing protein n=1 Tax=Bifiguratus adelaidae TaxID=1938954 RepID=A0A261XZJ0_9FUNG|nr:hypothetical protein BZG36_03464 [Bifiguratus adelaidae]